MSTSTQAEITMAAAVAKQAEATASQAVADSTKAASVANPDDSDLATSAIVQQEEAIKDQAEADRLLEIAIANESSTEVTDTSGMDTSTEQPTEETPPVVEIVTEQIQPESIAQISEPIIPAIETPVITGGPAVMQFASQPVIEVKVISPTVTQTASAKVSAPAVSGAVVNKVTASVSAFDEYIAKLKLTGTFIERNFISQMEAYNSAMKPGIPVDGHVGGRQQIGLWRSIQGIIERSGDEFTSAFSLLLAYFEEHKNGMFHEHHAFRFAETVALSNEELASFHAMLNLLKLTCDPVGRKHALTQVSLDRTLKNNISEQARQKILGFYGK